MSTLGSVVLAQDCSRILGVGKLEEAQAEFGSALFVLVLSESDTINFDSAKRRMERSGWRSFERFFSHSKSIDYGEGSIIYHEKLYPGVYAVRIEFSKGADKKIAVSEKLTVENDKVTIGTLSESAARDGAGTVAINVRGIMEKGKSEDSSNAAAAPKESLPPATAQPQQILSPSVQPWPWDRLQGRSGS